MSDWRLQTPVAFIIFNRPDTTERVFGEIAKAKPPTLLVVADGPRDSRSGEAERCRAARAIIERVDWDCEVKTNFSDANLGCKKRVASGIEWVFEEVPEAIILEDDCLPHPTFFPFCEEMLIRYRDDERIGMISGDNFQFGQRRSDDSYYFSRYAHIWGWASWRRAWRNYDRDIKKWPRIRAARLLEAIVRDPFEQRYWDGIFQAVYEGKIDTWDYQWVLACWTHNMLSIMPAVNLISNIGFGADATHTTNAGIYANLPTEALEFPLRHPEFVLPNPPADRFTAENMFVKSSRAKKIYDYVDRWARKY